MTGWPATGVPNALPHGVRHAKVRGTPPREVGGTTSLVAHAQGIVTPPNSAAPTATDPTDVTPIVADRDCNSDWEILIFLRHIPLGAVTGMG